MTNTLEKPSFRHSPRTFISALLLDKWREFEWDGNFNFSKPIHFMAFLLLIMLLTLIHSPMALRLPYLPEVGEIASRNIKANRDILVEDLETTTQRRNQAALEVPPVYDWDSGMIDLIIAQLEGSLSSLEPLQKEPTSQPPNSTVSPQNTSTTPTALSPPLDTRREAFTAGLEEEVQDKAYLALIALPHVQPLMTAIRNWLTSLNQQWVIDNTEVLEELSRTPFYTVRSSMDSTERRSTGITGILDLSDMHQRLSTTIGQFISEFSPDIQQWLLEETRTQIRPNFIFNFAETQVRRKLAYDSVEPVFFQARNGQMVVREGAIITNSMRMKLEVMYKTQWTDSILWRILGLATTLGSLLWMSRWFLLATTTAFPRDNKTAYLLGSILLIVSMLSALTYTIGQSMMELLNLPSQNMVIYLPEAALGAALASLTLGNRSGTPSGALIIGAMLSLMGALVSNGGLPLFAYYMAGSLVGAATLRTCRRRFDVLYCGLKIGIVQMIAMPVVELLSGSPPDWNWLLGGFMALLSGLLVGLWGLALIPLLESLFNITTDSRLTELASGHHSLIRDLSLRSPGTYHHSVMMGNLAEAAAESIHANPLLARVMALYHDIGKMNSPQYFVENQSGENRHDHLSPAMSTKVIMAHVKGGLELAKRHKLGEFIQEAITTHHGNSLLQYFYNRAINQATNHHETVSEEDFRYPGPRPHSREAGILMLADSVEAAARTLKTPAPAQIQALVKRIVSTKIRDGQLDECELTLYEMARIEEAFTRVLTLGFYHHRIEYPDQNRALQRKVRPNGKNTGNVRIQPAA